MQTDKYRELLKKYENNKTIQINDIDYITRTIYPDIIVHKRGKKDNLLIIEIKKSTSNEKEFDHAKLECYTDQSLPTSLRYKYGLYIEFKTTFKAKGEKPEHQLVWYTKGR